MLEALGIVAGYGHSVVLSVDHLSVGPGDRIAVIGASGSGKTTLLRVLAGLHRPRDGQVSCDGTARWSPERSADMGWVWPAVTLVFQEAKLFPNLSARDNCLIGFAADLSTQAGFCHILCRSTRCREPVRSASLANVPRAETALLHHTCPGAIAPLLVVG